VACVNRPSGDGDQRQDQTSLAWKVDKKGEESASTDLSIDVR
jgi:hypothetical protein